MDNVGGGGGDELPQRRYRRDLGLMSGLNIRAHLLSFYAWNGKAGAGTWRNGPERRGWELRPSVRSLVCALRTGLPQRIRWQWRAGIQLRVGLEVAVWQRAAQAPELAPTLSVARLRLPRDGVQSERARTAFICKSFIQRRVLCRHDLALSAPKPPAPRCNTPTEENGRREAEVQCGESVCRGGAPCKDELGDPRPLTSPLGGSLFSAVN